MREDTQWVPTATTQKLADTAGLAPLGWWRDLFNGPDEGRPLTMYTTAYGPVLGFEVTQRPIDLDQLTDSADWLREELQAFGFHPKDIRQFKLYLWSVPVGEPHGRDEA
jgi:hypothetical protein